MSMECDIQNGLVVFYTTLALCNTNFISRGGEATYLYRRFRICAVDEKRCILQLRAVIQKDSYFILLFRC